MDTAAPLANLITLGVQDFQRERDFYQALGWPIAFDSDDFVAFELQGVVLTLFPLDKLAADSRARPEVGQGGIRFSVIISVNTPEEVDRLADRGRAAGAVVTKPPTEAEFFEGRDAVLLRSRRQLLGDRVRARRQSGGRRVSTRRRVRLTRRHSPSTTTLEGGQGLRCLDDPGRGLVAARLADARAAGDHRPGPRPTTR